MNASERASVRAHDAHRRRMLFAGGVDLALAVVDQAIIGVLLWFGMFAVTGQPSLSIPTAVTIATAITILTDLYRAYLRPFRRAAVWQIMTRRRRRD